MIAQGADLRRERDRAHSAGGRSDDHVTLAPTIEPNEIALTVLLSILTLIFVIVVASIAPVAAYLRGLMSPISLRSSPRR
jgi:hypothetical protein